MRTEETKMENNSNTQEIILDRNRNGLPVLILVIAGYVAAVVLLFGSMIFSRPLLGMLAVLWLCLGWILFLGLKVLGPQEALVLTLFGKYVGTLKDAGFYFVNPFCVAVNPAAGTKLGQSRDVDDSQKPSVLSVITTGSKQNAQASLPSKKISLKIMTLNNSRQKVNDVLGNPVEIGVAVMWKVTDTAAVRNIVKIYPYDMAQNVDTTGDGLADDGSLRGSTEVVARRIKEEIQQKVEEAGLTIIDARITYLAYAPEIAAAMLQRQQASAIIDARKMIVDGAVGMVQMALEKLSEEQIVDLDDERKAAMVSNLLVVLCGNHDAQPVVNSGSLY